jgi:choline kinase
MQIAKTIIINAAGMGTRLSFGHTKALLEIGGKSLIYHHLDAVEDYNDVRIIVGYDYQTLIDAVLKRRRNVTFVFNHVYKSTGTLGSFFRGSRLANEMVVSLDGDLLINPTDLKKFLNSNRETIGYIPTYSDNPVCVDIIKKNSEYFATKFHRQKSQYEWTGLVQVRRDKITDQFEHVYQTLEPHLPMKAMQVDCREVDSPKDLVEAMKWAWEVFK